MRDYILLSQNDYNDFIVRNFILGKQKTKHALNIPINCLDILVYKWDLTVYKLLGGLVFV